jgi:two-component system, NtrC family, sensor histidine kinase HydH
MKTRQWMGITMPIIVMSAIPLLISGLIAWKVHRSQKNASEVLAANVISMRAGEELAIGFRDIRTQLERFLLTGDRKDLEAVPALREDTEPWLLKAEQAAGTDRERELIEHVKKGYEQFFREFEEISQTPNLASPDFQTRVRNLIPLTNEIILPAQNYLDDSEQEIAGSNKANQETADRMVLGLLLLGLCGPASGLLAGYGISRRVSRSIVRLSVPIRDAAGKLNEIVGPITLSARWDLEDLEVALRKIADRIGAVIQRLEQSQRDALRSEQLAAVGQMAAGMAHELRNPLMSIKVLTQAAAERSQPAVLDATDQTVLEEEIARLEHSIQTFLDFARPPQLEKRTFDVRPLLEQIVGVISMRAREQGVGIQCEFPASPLSLQADVGQFRQVILNLLLNALDAVPNGGKIWLKVAGAISSNGQSDRDCTITISVEDSGPGLPVQLGAKIFDPFVSTKETGLGLGLSICRRIVEAHGGEINAANRPEGGAAFTVRFPAVVEDRGSDCTPRGPSTFDSRSSC